MPPELNSEAISHILLEGVYVQACVSVCLEGRRGEHYRWEGLSVGSTQGSGLMGLIWESWNSAAGCRSLPGMTGQSLTQGPCPSTPPVIQACTMYYAPAH